MINISALTAMVAIQAIEFERKKLQRLENADPEDQMEADLRGVELFKAAEELRKAYTEFRSRYASSNLPEYERLVSDADKA